MGVRRGRPVVLVQGRPPAPSETTTTITMMIAMTATAIAIQIPFLAPEDAMDAHLPHRGYPPVPA
ncbi:hypothetical protein D7147_12615 [Micromonospora musae]|uniref:Uncharacterized protein n=1 Tax=Micromonospora musae TaxID=1894970 RepID=A0ABX9R8S1_9ACTN|nr:hypothetical protein D7147_12615 [Micromonospora musae]